MTEAISYWTRGDVIILTLAIAGFIWAWVVHWNNFDRGA